MEVEYKFLCPGELDHQKTMDIIGTLNMSSETNILSVDFEHISTKYLDSTKGTLRNSKIALRERLENSEFFSNNDLDYNFINYDLPTLEKESWKKFCAEVKNQLENQRVSYTRHILSFKWGGSAEDGLHKRSEVEFESDRGDIDFSRLDSEVYRLYKIADKEGIVALFTTMVRRIKVLIRFNDSDIEVCIDKGFLIKDEDVSDINKEHVLSEIELELNHGNEDDLKRVADCLSKKFNLTPNEVSKFQRGLNLYYGN